MNVLLIAPPGIHSDALSEWLPDLTPGCEVVRAVDPDAVIREAAAHRSTHLVLLDIDGAGSGLSDLIRAFVAAFPRVPVVALSAAEDDETINAAFDAGALGYIFTSYTRQVIMGVLQIVMAGATHRPAGSQKAPKAKPSPFFDPRHAESSLHDYGLTPAEVEVLAKAARGLSNKAIARELGRAPGTVRAHMSSILRKLGAKNRGEAIVIALRIDKVIRHEIQEAERGTLDRSLLLPHMSAQRLKEGAVIFRKGDAGRELFLLQRGTVRLKEIKVTLQPGELFGEIAIFSPDHRRTCTAVCETDAEVLRMTADKVKEIYYLNPQFALFIVHLVAKRLIADASRAV
jgi:DNA-binding NarL/FixJ family response regulator